MAVLDRVVRWHLDFDGDLFGDERERLRWYEGIATAASLQWLAIPWVAAILVWPLGRPSVLPLAAVLVALVIPMAMCTIYVRRRRVDTEVHHWTRKRVLLSVGFSVPLLAFMVGALRAWNPDSSVWRGAALGALFGAVVGGVSAVAGARRKRRLEAAAGDED